MIDLQDVKQLLHETDMLSLYLNVDNAVRENQAANPAWKIELKNALRDLENNLQEGQQEAWKTAHSQAEVYFRDYRPASKGLVVFFNGGGEQVYELPIPVENQAAFGEPLVAPLVWKLDEFEQYLVVMVDQEEARFYLSYLGQTEFEEGIEIDLEDYDFPRKDLMPASSAVFGGWPLTQGSHRDLFEQRIDEHRARFYRDVVDVTARILENTQARRVILAGSEQSAHAIHNEMDDKLKGHVIEVMSIPMQYKPHEIFEHILPVALEFERHDEERLVDEIIDFAKSGGRGALGKDAVEKALEMQQLDLLVMSWPPPDMEAANRLSQQTLALNSEVELVYGEAAEKLNAEGGIAARLYYVV